MKYRFILIIFLSFLIIAQLPYCKGENRFADKNIEEGYQLAKIYCAACHLFPEPSALDKNTWNRSVLPKMASFLGFSYMMDGYMENGSDTGVLTINQWHNILRYYISQAPEGPLKREKHAAPIQKQTALFTGYPFFAGIQQPATTLAQVDTLKNRLVFGDGSLEKLYFASPSLILLDSVKTGVGPANIHITDSGIYVLTMGVLYPSDALAGKMYYKSNGADTVTVLLDSLRRPVHAVFADLNNDQLDDIVLCEFGNRLGALSWFENNGDNKYTQHILRTLPGAIKTMIYDFNSDGKNDIVALMAQGDEGMFIYYNQGNSTFREQCILQFPPYYGSNHFQLADFNRDGFTDIVTSNGDNGDYSPILKPYHGIRIFLNDGKNAFTEKLFLPVNGIGKIIVKDFDADSNPDMASIAYFPDFEQTPEEGFIVWMNKGNMQFAPSSIPQVTTGRWLTMDAADIDNDGDLDILLGNADFRLGNIPDSLKTKWDTHSPSILILKNNLR